MIAAQTELPPDPTDVAVPVPPPAQVLDDSCIVAVLNRTAAVNSDGIWILPTVPANFGQVRARATCVRNGVTLFGQSDLFTIGTNQSVNLPDIVLGNTTPIPSLISVSSPLSTLSQAGQTIQLSVSAQYQSGTSQDITPSSAGTQYQVSNTAIATISADGLVTAVSSGNVLIQALNEGAQGILSLQVNLGGANNGGIPNSWILSNFCPNFSQGVPCPQLTDPSFASEDPDHDGLTNLQEFQIGTDPNNPDTDGDGLTDGQEVLTYHTNPLLASSDGTGIPDGIEVQTNTLGGTFSVKLAAALKSVEIKPATFALTVNTIIGQASQPLSILGHLIDGKTTLDITSTQKGTNYQSSDLTICNFGSPDGTVFASANGNCTITATNSGISGQSLGVVTSFAPTPLSFVTIPGFANGVDTNGNFAFVAAGASGLQVVNVNDKSHPVVAASLSLPGNANGVKLVGNTALIAGGSVGLHAVDVSNPLQPTLLNTLFTSGTALDVTAVGTVAYVANTTNLFIVDISNPASMAKISSLSIAGQIRGVTVDAQRGLAAVAASTNGVYFVDVSNPAAPVQRSNVAIANAHKVAFKNNFALVANFHTTTAPYQSSLVSVDTTNPASPAIVSSITDQTLGGNLNDVAAVGNFALSADVVFVNGIPITDISDPTSLKSRAILNFPQRDDNGLGIVADTSFVYLATDHSAIDKFGTTGDGRLYIGQYLSPQDNKGVAPTVTITAPSAGASVVAGSIVPVSVTATDDVAVAAVAFLANGQPVFTTSTPPYQFYLAVPLGVTSMTIGATAVDFGGNVGNAPGVTLNVIPDVGTTVIGRVLNNGSPASGASVTTNGSRSSTTGTDGTFTISSVPAAAGNIRVTATATINGSQVTRTSVPVPPVDGGTTNVGDINLTPTVINFENIAGISPMGNSPGSTVPTNARLSTQLQTAFGVTLSSDAPYIAVVLLGVGHATSGSNGVGGVTTSNTLAYSSPIIATFNVPGDPSTPGVTDFVSIRGDQFPAAGNTATMQAFDINGVLIGIDTEPDIPGGLTLSISVPGIHSVRVTEAQPNIAFDDLTFDPPKAAPH